MMTAEIRDHVADRLRDVWVTGTIVAVTLFVLGAIALIYLEGRVEKGHERLDVIEAQTDQLAQALDNDSLGERLDRRIEWLHSVVRQVEDDLAKQRLRFAEHAAYKGPIQTADERIDELEAYVATLEERLAAHAEHAAQNE